MLPQGHVLNGSTYADVARGYQAAVALVAPDIRRNALRLLRPTGLLPVDEVEVELGRRIELRKKEGQRSL